MRTITYNDKPLSKFKVGGEYEDVRSDLRDLALSDSQGSISYPSDDLTLFEYATAEGTVTGRLYQEGGQNFVELEGQDGRQSEEVLIEVEEALSGREKPLAD